MKAMQRRRQRIRRAKRKHADSPAATTTSPKRLKGNDATPIPTRSQEAYPPPPHSKNATFLPRAICAFYAPSNEVDGFSLNFGEA